MAIPELVITGHDIPPYSTRAAHQTLTPIQADQQVARTINGLLLDLSNADFQMFASTITCTDMQVPTWLFPGVEVTVDCLAELSYKNFTGAPIRTVVYGSERVDGDYTFYRPQLIMRILTWNLDEDIWGAATAWTLNLEESQVVAVTT